MKMSMMGKPNLMAYAACVWAFLFAAMSFYWALGGTIGKGTLGNEIESLASDRSFWFVAVLWITGVLKAIAGLLALAFTNSWGRIIPRWILLSAGWFIGIFLSLYGGANLFIRGLMAVGVMATPESMHSTAARWHLLFWDPWWLLGGLLFIFAVLHFNRNTHEKRLKSLR